MTKKFNNRYRIASVRASWWEYTAPGAYFITICTYQNRPYFGKPDNLSPVGQIATTCWHDIPHHHTVPITLGAFVVMPNHIHGLIELGGNQGAAPQPAAALQSHPHLRIPANSIPAIIRGYKSAVTKLAHRQGINFRWHSRYYDHIVRDDAAYNRITQYILTNPQRL
ncbi:MAG: transposase [Chloroflexia bacterium]|nr:transposase [Chloroflexia bacterium]